MLKRRTLIATAAATPILTGIAMTDPAEAADSVTLLMEAGPGTACLRAHENAH
jgi:hypothetical protein